jgi:hypothetical protein
MQRSTLLMLAPAVAAVVLAACSSSRPIPAAAEPIPPDDRPADFVLAATVHSPESMSKARLPRSLQPARYVVEADGVLRAAVGGAAQTTTFPGRTRQLTPREFDALWRLVRESGLLDSQNVARIEGPDDLTRAPDRTTAIVYVSFGGRRMTLRTLLDRTSPGAAETERVIDRLAEWAWVNP